MNVECFAKNEQAYYDHQDEDQVHAPEYVFFNLHSLETSVFFQVVIFAAFLLVSPNPLVLPLSPIALLLF